MTFEAKIIDVEMKHVVGLKTLKIDEQLNQQPMGLREYRNGSIFCSHNRQSVPMTQCII